MAWQLDDQSQLRAVEQAPATAEQQHVGRFRLYFEDQRWEWSDQVQRMHGYEPGTVTPTTELVLSHKHPDDRDMVAATIKKTISTRQAFRLPHRIIDTGGAVHHVVVVGDQLRDDNGEVIGTHGFYITLAPETEHSAEEVITAKVAEIAERRAAIEQTKGMLMLIYGIDETAAFRLLQRLSQEYNVKLRSLAQQVAKDFATVGETTINSRAVFDQLLLTAHRRA